jgi:excisionase family DNA binding protein
MTQSHLLSLPEFCRENRISRSTAYRLLQEGALRAVKIGRLTRIDRSDSEAWRAALATYKRATTKPKPEPWPKLEPSSRPGGIAKRKARRRPASPRRSVRSDG